MRISRSEEGGINLDFEEFTDEYFIFAEYLEALEQDAFDAGYKQGRNDAKEEAK